ncbi:hypothetical protein BJ322DRAFT_1102350 [Thelephora terrestris]|uniref:Uncharacterized protein n=1 Tax=Thelephora terrestris TaxID=56493 RepID=A0A9P6H1G2_9AGAM|nr:hypothetical protein BJ322DRAFT_1102350 [Thelephora terrestris]
MPRRSDMSEMTYLDIEMTDVMSETTHLDVEMNDTCIEEQDLLSTDHELNPSPSPSVMANSHNTDGLSSYDDLLETIPDHLASPIIIGSDTDTDLSDSDDDPNLSDHDDDTRQICQDSATPPESGGKPFVVKFGGRAGETVGADDRHLAYTQYSQDLQAEDAPCEWAPFSSRVDWEIARWAKLRGPSSTALSELLGIDGLASALGLSYSSANELNQIIDRKLPSGLPEFVREEVTLAGQTYEFYHRDILQCIRTLYGDPELANFLVHAPERHFTGPDKETRMYSEMHTGKWWWTRQVELENEFGGVTIVPLLISSDKTRVVMFGTKSAYPVYLTIGNIPKELRRKPSRRTHVLLGYLPTTPLHHVSSTASRRRMVANLFHYCMSRILAPLKQLATTGPIEMSTGNGVIRRTFPIFACFIGDYPEQVLVSGCKTGDCPKCPTKQPEMGEFKEDNDEYRDLAEILEALATFEKDPAGYSAACSEAGIKPIVHPFWQDLPYSDIYLGITPDVLHQLYQGVMKHLMSWVTAAFGEKELDARCKSLPPNHNIRSFSKGITSLSRVTGKEHADMCRILLGLVVDLKLSNGSSPIPLIRAIRSLLDFLYLSQYPIHTSETLRLLHQSLERFHENKHIFIELGIRNNFNLPKLHSLLHYVHSIKTFGTTDNYNTEYTERLHIDLAKDAYRATNHRDEYAQMTAWLQRKEKWRHTPRSTIVLRSTDTTYNGTLTVTKWPSVRTVSFDDIISKHGARFFREALRRYSVLAQHSGPPLTRSQLERKILYTKLPSQPCLSTIGSTKRVTMDSIRAQPERRTKKGKRIPPRFDTALLTVGSRYRVGQVRVVFALPSDMDGVSTGLLAYVEWFTKFTASDHNHEMFKLTRCLEGGKRIASIVPVSTIRRSVHLFPKFGPAVPDGWSSDNVLDKHMYLTL